MDKLIHSVTVLFREIPTKLPLYATATRQTAGMSAGTSTQSSLLIRDAELSHLLNLDVNQKFILRLSDLTAPTP